MVNFDPCPSKGVNSVHIIEMDTHVISFVRLLFIINDSWSVTVTNNQ